MNLSSRMNNCCPCVSKAMQKCKIKVSTRRWKVAESSSHQEGRLWLRAVSQMGQGLQLTIISDLACTRSPIAIIQCHQTGTAHQKLLRSCSLKHTTFTAHAQKKPKTDFSPFDLVVKEVFSHCICISM